MNELRYKQSPKSRTSGFIISAIFMTLGVVIFASLDDPGVFARYCALFVITLGIMIIGRLIMNKDRVIVNKDGIWSRLNRQMLVRWEYIEGFEIKPLRNGIAIVVKINEPEMLLNEKGGFAQTLMRSNIKKMGSPVLIPEHEIDKPAGVVAEELEAYRQKVKPADI